MFSNENSLTESRIATSKWLVKGLLPSQNTRFSQELAGYIQLEKIGLLALECKVVYKISLVHTYIQYEFEQNLKNIALFVYRQFYKALFFVVQYVFKHISDIDVKFNRR